jgi:3-deoxy-D-manno-octulosonate 8-phosphate phosphatase (KDO 8-P phosphatase)
MASDSSRPSIRLLVLDVDGVLTDGGIQIADDGRETKRYHVHDGCGLRIWQRLGGDVAVLTGRSGMGLRHRLNELGIESLVNGSKDKGADFARLLQAKGLRADEVAMLGDDLPDLPVLRRCGYPMAVANASPEVKAVARFTTTRRGGDGAVREAIEHLLATAGRWDEAVRLYDV